MEGLSKRELFAAIAMQAILANPFRDNQSVETEAVIQADKLIAELEKSRSSDTNIREVLRRLYDLYSSSWHVTDRVMVQRILGIEDRR